MCIEIVMPSRLTVELKCAKRDVLAASGIEFLRYVLLREEENYRDNNRGRNAIR